MFRTDPDQLTTAGAARILGVSKDYVLTLLGKGALPCTRTPAGHARIPRSAVEAMRDEADADDDGDTSCDRSNTQTNRAA